MIIAAVVLSGLSLAVSTTTLIVVLVGANRAQKMVAETAQTVDSKVQALKQAVVNL